MELAHNTTKVHHRLRDIVYRRIHGDVIVYIFAHLHAALRIEENMLDMN